MNRVIPILAGLVFLHALLSAPLLVQCIGADGRGLIEILGHDPCHGPQAPITAGPGKNPATRLFTASDHFVDPCQDSMLDSPGCYSPHVETVPATPRATDSAGPVPRPCTAGAHLGLIRAPGRLPLIPPGLHSHSALILRI